MSGTPVTKSALVKYDHLPPEQALFMAWTNPGTNPKWHKRMQEDVRNSMPLLGKALDRLADKGKGGGLR